jgi:hypothetical protein
MPEVIEPILGLPTKDRLCLGIVKATMWRIGKDVEIENDDGISPSWAAVTGLTKPM